MYQHNDCNAYTFENIIDLKIKQSKMQFELAYSILSIEKLGLIYSKSHLNKVKDVFLNTSIDLYAEKEYIIFLEKLRNNNIDQDLEKCNEKQIQFFEYMDSINKMSLKDIDRLKDKLVIDIKKLEKSVDEIESLILRKLPNSKYIS